MAEGSDSSYSDCKKERPHGVKDVQGSLTQAIADTDRNSGIKLTVCLRFAPNIKTIKRSFQRRERSVKMVKLEFLWEEEHEEAR